MYGLDSPAYSKAGEALTSRGYSQHNTRSALNPSVPSLPNHYEGNDRMSFRGNSSREFRAKDTRNIPAFELTQGDWLRQSAKAFRAHTGERPGAAKELAAELECSDKTTRSWLAGETAPSGILDLRAMARIPAYAALKRKLAAQESQMDPRVQATIQELHRMSLQLAGEEI